MYNRIFDIEKKLGDTISPQLVIVRLVDMIYLCSKKK